MDFTGDRSWVLIFGVICFTNRSLFHENCEYCLSACCLTEKDASCSCKRLSWLSRYSWNDRITPEFIVHPLISLGANR